MKKYILLICIFLITASLLPAQNTDTVIDGRHYNTVIKYHNFDYKGQKELSYITAYGTTKDSLKEGSWMYVLPNGDVLATGRFQKGYKHGSWKYRGDDGRYFITTWNKSDKVKDYVYFENNVNPQLIDYLSASGIRWKNGAKSVCGGIRWL